MSRSSRVVRRSSSHYVGLFPRLFVSALALAFFATGTGLLAQCVLILRTWRPIDATVARSDVIGFRNSDNKQRNMYRGEVELAYRVEGQEYRTPDSFNHASTSEASIRDQMETTYAVGTRHRVFYNPANPYSLLWNVGTNLTFFLLPILFGGVGLILIGVCWWLWKLPFPPQRECSGCGGRIRPGDHYCQRCGESDSPESSPHAAPRATRGRDVDEEPKRENTFLMPLLAVFIGLPGVACLLGACYIGTANYHATQTWPMVEATVTSSIIETNHSRDGRPVYRLGVAFEYDGVQHAEHAAGQSIYVSGNYAWIVQRLRRFPLGSRHTIRVNPQDPADIRFDLDSLLLNWLPTAGVALLGSIFAAIGAGLLIGGTRPRCKQCRRQVSRQASYCPACGQGRDPHTGLVPNKNSAAPRLPVP